MESQARHTVPAGDATSAGEAPWRAPLVTALFKVNVVAIPAGTAVTWLATKAPLARVVLAAAGTVALAILVVELLRPRLGVRGRSLVLVGSYLGISLVGVAYLGFIAGPVLMACAALLLARTLLGRRALLVVAALLAVGNALISWAVLAGALHWEVEAVGPSLYDAAAWLRHVVVTVFLLVVVGVIIGYVVDAVEVALADNARLLVEARRATQLRDQFLSIASHELRTPLASLKLATEGLVGGRLPATGESLARWLPLVQRNVDRLADLVAQLLDVSRIETGRLDLTLEEVDLTTLVGASAEVFAMLPEGRVPLALDLAPGVRGRWDHGRLEQVVVNLLTNARRFGNGQPVEVTLTSTPTTATLVVRDHGVGIAPELAARLFTQPCPTAPGGARGGLGLGLYIVHGIVTSLGGTVRLERFPGDGSAFIVNLPLAGPAPAPAPAAPAAAPAPAAPPSPPPTPTGDVP